MSCGCEHQKWMDKPIYQRAETEWKHKRYFCEDWKDSWVRVYGSVIPWRVLVYLWFAAPTYCCCTCKTCAGWR